MGNQNKAISIFFLFRVSSQLGSVQVNLVFDFIKLLCKFRLNNKSSNVFNPQIEHTLRLCKPLADMRVLLLTLQGIFAVDGNSLYPFFEFL